MCRPELQGHLEGGWAEDSNPLFLHPQYCSFQGSLARLALPQGGCLPCSLLSHDPGNCSVLMFGVPSFGTDGMRAQS